MQIEDLSVLNNMDSEVLQGMDNPTRLGAINEAAKKPQSNDLEVDSVKMGVQDVVKNLSKENQEMFPDKEEVAEINAMEKKEDKKDTNKQDITTKTIMGMNPIVFGLLVISVGIVGYVIYKQKKTTK